MGLGLGLGIWWPTQTSIIPGLLKALCARATYCENKTCTTAILEEIAAVRYTPPPPPTGILLVDYPGAAAAYSLRNLIDTTTSVVRVRRSSDNTEQDFTEVEITDGTLTTFTGANDGFVTILYDQSGNNINSTQTTAVNQPIIVDNGVLILINGLPSIKFADNNDNLLSNLSYAGSNLSVFSVYDNSLSGFADVMYLDSNLNTPDGLFNYRDEEKFGFYRSSLYSFGDIPDGQSIGVNILTSTEAFFYNYGGYGGGIVGSSTASNAIQPCNFTSFRIGRDNTWNFQEMVVYPSNQTTNIDGIKDNVNNKYKIIATSGLLADYPGAAAAYSLRNLSNTTTNVVRVRRSSDNTEQNFTAAEITDGTLTAFTGTNDGFVTIWNDQSGNNRNATELDPNKQAKIVDNGVVNLQDGKPALAFDGINDKYIFTDINTVNDTSSIFAVVENNGDSNDKIIISGGGTGSLELRLIELELWAVRTGQLLLTVVSSPIGNNLITSLSDSSSVDLTVNNTTQIGTVPPNSSNRLNTIGLAPLSDSFEGNIQEIIIYDSNQSANKTGIETNINTEYTIY